MRADATEFRPSEGQADVVTLSYALTMIPDWFAAIENACAMLKPGGVIGVADFYVSRKRPAQGRSGTAGSADGFGPHGLPATTFSYRADHLPFLRSAL